MEAAQGQQPPFGEFQLLALIAEFDRSTSFLTFAQITKGALAFMAKRLSLGRVSVALCRSEGDGFLLFDTTCEVGGVESGRIIPTSSASLSETVVQKRAIYRPDIRNWPNKNPVDEAFIARGFFCTFSAPMILGGICRGTLNCAVQDVDGIELTTRRLIELLASRLAHALEMGIALDALAESEARFRDVFEKVGDGVVVVSSVGRQILMANAAFCRLIGRSASELCGPTIEICHPRERMEEITRKFDAIARGETELALEVPLLRSDGSELPTDITAKRTTISGKPCIVGVFRDATPRRALEDENLQVRNLESVRTLAAGIAHDFNNLLTGILGNVTLAQALIPDTAEPWELLDEAQRAASRATALTRQLLTFAKGGAPVRGRAELIQVLRQSTEVASSGVDVQIQLELPNESWFVWGDEGQLNEAFVNLLRNAVEATPAGGCVRMRIWRQPCRSGEEVCVEIADQGPGIPAEELDKIFVPFFTTKARRVGLGLPVAHSIVQNHGGWIRATSEHGVGTQFLVGLPALEIESTSPAPPSTRAPAEVRVLVMDDEAIVIQLMQRALRKAGYDVKAVCSGQDAVEAYADSLKSGQRFDAVILDLTVPGGMGGKEAAKRILALDESARLMVSSGYSDDSVMADFERHGFSAVLQKPYSATQLSEAVNSLIAR